MRSLLKNRSAMVGIVLGLIVALAAVGMLIMVGLYLNESVYSSLGNVGANTTIANQTITAVRDNTISAYGISAVAPIILAAAAVIGIIVVGFSFRRH